MDQLLQELPLRRIIITIIDITDLVFYYLCCYTHLGSPKPVSESSS